MKLTLGTQLGPYEILAQIGAGGMGEVWKAQDTRLGRIVAIKTVKEQHSERFKQEARTIAALNHSYICQLFDIGPDYLVLEYIEGKPLSSPLPEQEAVRLAIQIATALEEAHQKGIIHRDLKPSNIMVTDKGSVKLLDFGLAKLYEQSTSESTAEFPATQAGAVLGTVAYMSPEQAQGQPADVRSDIFSFGLVLYEMLSGKRAFAGDSNYAVMNAIIKEEPSALQASVPLEKIVRRCLAKQPSGRYQTMSEVKTALEQVLKEKASGSSAEPQPSIAVLPFVNMSGDKDQEYFSDGLAEEIINALAQIPGLKVTARTSAFAFRGKEQDITKIAEALHVRTILEGSVRKSGNRIRISAQLINAADGYHLWSERYDRDMTDVFAIQDEISQAISEKLRVSLSGGHPMVKGYKENVEAYNLYLKGRYQLHKSTLESLGRSKEYFEQALATVPNYALAWYGKALCYYCMGFMEHMAPKEANAKSSQAIQKALDLDEMLPEAHSMMGVLRASEFDWKGAESEFLRALQLDPESVDVWSNYSFSYLVPMGRLDEAIACTRKCLELDPLSAPLHCRLGIWNYFARQWDQAIKQFDNALEIDRNFNEPHLFLGLAYIDAGRFGEGIRAVEAAAQLSENSPLFLASLGFVYAVAGRIDDSLKVLAQMQELAEKSYVSPIDFGWIYLALKQTDRCFDWFDKAIDEHGRMIHFHVHPWSEPLRSHPRYQALLRKMNLEP